MRFTLLQQCTYARFLAERHDEILVRVNLLSEDFEGSEQFYEAAYWCEMLLSCRTADEFDAVFYCSNILERMSVIYETSGDWFEHAYESCLCRFGQRIDWRSMFWIRCRC